MGFDLVLTTKLGSTAGKINLIFFPSVGGSGCSEYDEVIKFIKQKMSQSSTESGHLTNGKNTTDGGSASAHQILNLMDLSSKSLSITQPTEPIFALHKVIAELKNLLASVDPDVAADPNAESSELFQFMNNFRLQAHKFFEALSQKFDVMIWIGQQTDNDRLIFPDGPSDKALAKYYVNKLLELGIEGPILGFGASHGGQVGLGAFDRLQKIID